MDARPAMTPAEDDRAGARAADAVAPGEQLAARAALANDALAAAQDRTYWLDRLHLDLNGLMARPLARRAIALLPIARECYRAARDVSEALRRLAEQRQALRHEAAEDAARAGELAGAAGGLADAVSDQLERAGLPLAPGVAALCVTSASTPGLEPLRVRCPGIELADASAALPLPHPGARFDLILFLSGWPGAGGAAGRAWLEEIDRLLADEGRLMLATREPVEALLDRTGIDWAVLACDRRGRAGGHYLLRRG
jgi:hypothetical protein